MEGEETETGDLGQRAAVDGIGQPKVQSEVVEIGFVSETKSDQLGWNPLAEGSGSTVERDDGLATYLCARTENDS